MGWDLGKAIKDAAKGAVQQGVDQIKRGAEGATRDAVQKPINDAVNGARDHAQGAIQGVISGQFSNAAGLLDKAKLTAAMAALPENIDPRKSPAMTALIEKSLGTVGARGASANGSLDANDLKAMNQFLAQQGSKPIQGWEDLKRDDLKRLIEQTSARDPRQAAQALSGLDGAVSELKEAYSVADNAAQNPGAALRRGAEAAASTAGSIWDRVRSNIPKADPNAPAPQDPAMR